MLANDAGVDAAKSFVASAGLAADTVRVVASVEKPRTFADVRGGDAYFINNQGRCSIGFPVVGGFVSAGHCGKAGARVTNSSGASEGTFQASSFPDNDYSWVKTTANFKPVGVVNHYDGTTVAVKGSQEAAVGASICRSGSTTGWHCGTVQAKKLHRPVPGGPGVRPDPYRCLRRAGRLGRLLDLRQPGAGRHLRWLR